MNEKNHVLPRVYTPYLVLTITLCSLTGAYRSNQNPVWTQKPYISPCLHTVFSSDYCVPPRVHSNQNPSWTQKPCISVSLDTIFGSDYYVSPQYHNNQNPEWTQKPCIPVCLHTIFGPDYYVPARGHSNQNPTRTQNYTQATYNNTPVLYQYQINNHRHFVPICPKI